MLFFIYSHFERYSSKVMMVFLRNLLIKRLLYNLEANLLNSIDLGLSMIESEGNEQFFRFSMIFFSIHLLLLS